MNDIASTVTGETTGVQSDCLRELTRKDFQSGLEVRWCPGCGDYAILAQIQKALPDLGIPREKFVFVSGIGCSSRFPYYMNTYGFHTIHGRAPAVALGLKCGNPDLSVWVITGDGDGLSIGTNHLIHCLRRNVDLNILLFNNRIYGLTKGQYSPTSELGKKTKSSPVGTIEEPIRPIRLALAAEATFAARTVAADQGHLRETLDAAARHRGTSFVEILQNCRVFNDGTFELIISRQTSENERVLLHHGEPIRFGPNGGKGIAVRNMEPQVVDLEKGEASVGELLVHDVRSTSPALASLLAALEPPDFPMALGVFRDVEKPTYDDSLMSQIESVTAQRGKGDVSSQSRLFRVTA